MIYFELIVKLYKKTKVNIKLHDTKLLGFISATILLGKITSPKDVLWTSPYDPLCNAKGRPLPTS